jgi:hypothetical protein
MRTSSRILLICAMLFAFCSVAFAAEYWVIRDNSDKMIIVEQRPADTAVIVKGPFATRTEAEVIITGPVSGAVVTPSPVPVPPPPAVPLPLPPPPAPPTVR